MSFGRTFGNGIALAWLAALVGVFFACAKGKESKSKRSATVPVTDESQGSSAEISSTSLVPTEVAVDGSKVLVPAGAFGQDVKISVKEVRDSFPALQGVATLGPLMGVTTTDSSNNAIAKAALLKPLQVVTKIDLSTVTNVTQIIVMMIINPGTASETLRAIPNNLLTIHETGDGTATVTFLVDEPNFDFVVSQVPADQLPPAFIFYQAPEDAKSLTATVSAGSSVLLKWEEAATGASLKLSAAVTSRYTIAFDLGETAPETCALGSVIAGEKIGAGTQYLVEALSPGEKYGFRLCTLNADGPPSKGITTTASVTGPAGGGADEGGDAGQDDGLGDDLAPPVVGGGGALADEGTSDKTVIISFAKASDDQTAAGSLVYEVYYRVGLLADANKLDSVVNVLANGQKIAATLDVGSDPLTATIDNFAPSTNYVITILVKDGAGNKAVYQPVQVTTAADATPPVPGDDGLTYLTGTTAPTSLNLSWTKATDLGTPASALKYSVYYDTKDALDLVSDMTNYGVLANTSGGDANIVSFSLTGLKPSTSYLLNLFTEDQLTNKAAYRVLQAATPPHFVAVAAGSNFACGLTSAGVVYCWGRNDYGAIGNDTTNFGALQLVPDAVDRIDVDADGAGVFVQIGAGTDFTCGLTSDGSAYCWGYGNTYRRGDGTTANAPVPTKVDDSSLTSADGKPVQLAVGRDHGCILLSSSKVYCWGYGRAIDNTVVDKATMVAVDLSGIDGKILQVTAGVNVTCAVADTGKAYCWGFDAVGDGIIGDGGTTSRATPTLVDVSGLSVQDRAFKQIIAGYQTACAVSRSGKAFCWGDDTYGQIGDGDAGANGTADADVHVPTAVATTNIIGDASFLKVTISGSVSGSAETVCGLTTEGRLYCWGANGNYQTGVNATDALVFLPKPVNQAVVGMHERFRDVSIGSGGFGCAITVGGAPHCWGTQDDGRAGTNSNGGGNVLMASFHTDVFTGSQTFSDIAGGGNHACGLASEGSLYCWGSNSSGQLGINSSSTSVTTATAVDTRHMSGRQQFRAFALGANHSCGVSVDGLAFCWGDGTSGQLGTGSTVSASKPTAVSSSDKYLSVAAGGEFSCGITASSVAKCWGDGASGQLGTGTTTDASSPAAVDVTALGANEQKFRQLAVGGQHACAISVLGKVYCWGAGASGQIGDASASPTARLSPTAISTTNVTADAHAETFKEVVAGTAHSCALTSDGKIYCWGDNTHGQLGINSASTSAVTPVQIHMGDVGANSTFIDIVAGSNHTCAVTSLRAAYCWGQQAGEGRLGNNGIVKSIKPVAVITTGLSGDKSFQSLTAGANFTCGVTGDGLAYCWGSDASGQNGNGAAAASKVPAAVTLPW